jgi:hypothetical protein
VSQCVERMSGGSACDITVGEVEACVLVMGREPCDVYVAPECLPMRSCARATGGGG